MWLKVCLSIPYVLVFLGSVGMVIFSYKFSFTTAVWEQKYTQEKFLGMNGHTFWVVSWALIILGTLGQLVSVWVQ